MSFFLQFFYVLLMLLCVWGAGFFLFLHYVQSLSTPGNILPTEGIVVFTGDDKRLEMGFFLSKQNKNEKVLISGVLAEKKSVTHSLKKNKNHPPQLTLGYAAQDTIGNALETAAWARKNGVRTLKVVTSDYHMVRSLLELSSAFPEGILVPYPVKTNSSQDKIKIFREYNKLIYSFFHFFSLKIYRMIL